MEHSIDREKVIKGVFEMLQRDTWKDIDQERHRFQPVLNDVLKLLKEQEAQKFFVDESGKITPLPVVVRCKDCRFFTEPDSQGDRCAKIHWSRCDEWFCADGERAE